MLTITKEGNTIKVCQTREEAATLIENLAKAKKTYALDFETTALHPRDSKDARVRITSIATTPTISWVIDHDLCGSFDKVFCDRIIGAGRYYVFNVNFEGRWFEHSASRSLARKLLDVGHMRRSVMGGGPWSLLTMTKKDLGEELDKEEQLSDWGAKKLTPKQYYYAGKDALVTLRLGRKWSAEMSKEHWNGFWIINEAWSAVNEIQETGMKIDIPYHKTLIRMWQKRKDAAEACFRKFIPERVIANIRSKKQLSDFFKAVLDDAAIAAWPKTEKTEQLQLDRAILRSMSYASPYPFSRILAALMVFNRADKYLGTYGDSLVSYQELSRDGRIHSRLNMAQAVTGRFSSSGPNQQNYPRAYNFRYSFIVEKGKKQLIADYSGIEIRVLAELSKDKILLRDAVYGDVHTESAIAIFGIADADGFKERLKKKDPRAKEMRSKAKGFTFQLLYGAGASALAITLRCSIEEAEQAIVKWAQRYSRAYHYRQEMYSRMHTTGFLPVCDGRTIYVHRRDMSMPVAANYPVQGAAASVMYAAIRRVKELYKKRGRSAKLMASIHDEVLVLTNEADAEEDRLILEEGLKLGWLDIFPNSNTDNMAEAVVADRWSEKA